MNEVEAGGLLAGLALVAVAVVELLELWRRKRQRHGSSN